MVRSTIVGKPARFLETVGFVFILTEEELQKYDKEERIEEWYDDGSEDILVLPDFVGSIYFDIIDLKDGESLLPLNFDFVPLAYMFDQFDYPEDVDYELTLFIDGDVPTPITVSKFVEARI